MYTYSVNVSFFAEIGMLEAGSLARATLFFRILKNRGRACETREVGTCRGFGHNAIASCL